MRGATRDGGSWPSNLPRAQRCFHVCNRPRAAPVVLLGHESQGIPDHVVAEADQCVDIPMVGRGASLNVAVAGSLVLYRLTGLF